MSDLYVSIRDRLIEDLALEIHRWECATDLETMANEPDDIQDGHRFDAARYLDSILAVLSEHADEWMEAELDATVEALRSGERPSVRYGGQTVRQLLAVLADPEEET